MKMSFGNFVRNVLTSRSPWIRNLIDPRRDIDSECGHPQVLTTDDYQNVFARGDIGSRIIKLYPEECWSENPAVFETEDTDETEFEKEWKRLDEKLGIYSHFQRIDVLSGIGRFGVMLMGIADGKDLLQPVTSIDAEGNFVPLATPTRLMYLRPFDEGLVTIGEVENDPRSPRYGQPRTYNLTFTDSTSGTSASGMEKTATMTRSVHWTRVIHVADNRTSSDVYGLPRLEVVMNRLLDLKKIAGGSGEMFWKGGFPGLSLETQPGLDDVEIDKVTTKEQMDAYMNGLQRYIALTGMQAKSLSPQVADPKYHIEAQIRLIAIAMAVPWRILMGVEVGQLASEQDIRAWNRRLDRRRAQYLTPYMIRPFVDRLLAFGILPQPKKDGRYIVSWSDLNSPSDGDKAAVAEKRTAALVNYVQSGADALIPPYHYLTLVMKFTDDEAISILDKMGESELMDSIPRDSNADNSDGGNDNQDPPEETTKA
jgi:uncharacterized protein